MRAESANINNNANDNDLIGNLYCTGINDRKI